MPLKKGTSKKTFNENVSKETKALEAKGKSPKKAELEEEPVTKHHARTDIQQVIRDCLKTTAKDGLAWNRMENVENCFW